MMLKQGANLRVYFLSNPSDCRGPECTLIWSQGRRRPDYTSIWATGRAESTSLPSLKPQEGPEAQKFLHHKASEAWSPDCTFIKVESPHLLMRCNWDGAHMQWKILEFWKVWKTTSYVHQGQVHPFGLRQVVGWSSHTGDKALAYLHQGTVHISCHVHSDESNTATELNKYTSIKDQFTHSTMYRN